MPDPIPAGGDLAGTNLTETVVAEARAWIGTPYRHQASLRGVGCDCLGLLRGVWRAVLGPEPEDPPPYAPGWAEAAPGAEALADAAGRHLVPVGDPLAGYRPRPGDVLLFAFRAHLPARHCAIATGPDAMVHAHDGAAVTEVALTPWWRRHLAAAFRFPKDVDPAPRRSAPLMQTVAADATWTVDQNVHFGGSSRGSSGSAVVDERDRREQEERERRERERERRERELWEERQRQENSKVEKTTDWRKPPRPK